MAEENKHPPTTEEQTPPEMPGKAPEKEQAEIPDVGAGPAPSAKVIDLSAVRSTPEKDAPTDIPKEPEAQPVSATEYSKQEWKKPMPEPEKTKPKRGRPAKSEKAAPTEPGAKKEAKAEKPRRGRPSKAEKAAPEQTKPPKAGKTHAAPEEKAAPPAPEVPPTPRDATRAEKEEIVYLDLSDLHPFKDHPFGVRDDTEMKSLVESVRNGGVNQPALVRPRELDKENKLSPDVIDGILCEEKKKEDRDVIITGAELEKFFGKEATPRQMKDQIMTLLEDWKERQPPELAKPDKKMDMEK